MDTWMRAWYEPDSEGRLTLRVYHLDVVELGHRAAIGPWGPRGLGDRCETNGGY